MSISFDLSIEISEQYDFTKESLIKIELNPWVRNQWPLVYFIQNESIKKAYVGESTNASKRIRNHLDSPKKRELNKISIIGSDKFNKSATLDIEHKLIQYIAAEGTYKLQNGNHGLINHHYYQQDLYTDLFKNIWEKLIEKKIVSKSLKEIENSELFKYSPYKSLNPEQYSSVLQIIEKLNTNKSNRIFIKGNAGTGKTILATYLIKLLNSDVSDSNLDEYSEDEINEIRLIRRYQKKFPDAKIGLVIAMTSIRKTLKDVFRKTPGLHADMILSPSDTFKTPYDLLIVDEAHRLRQYKNISWRGVFRKNNRRLKLGDDGNELDWLLANSKHQIFFYDAEQSVRPSDVDAIEFDKLLKDNNVPVMELTSQMRVKGGTDYLSFVRELLNVKRKKKEIFIPDNYELKIFDSLKDLYQQLAIKENKYELCRLVAGYSWPWLSDPKRKPKPAPGTIDIRIDGLEFQWNQTDKGWVHSEDAFEEVGCIHTTQGYDLNYTGVIFGEEISYNKKTGEIEIDRDKYFDNYGKNGVEDTKDLKRYIINIYKTLMYRGIRGTYVYACNEDLRDYLKGHIETYSKGFHLRKLAQKDVKPYINSVPLFDIKAAAGSFSEQQIHTSTEWVELPMKYTPKKGYFVCRVVGESMNEKIPNGSYCLFKEYTGGTRSGEIVLVQHTKIQHSEFGSGYTVKKYESSKKENDINWEHIAIKLKPMSDDPEFEDLVFTKEDLELEKLKIVGIFVDILNL